jgi:hypothetical protein
MFFNELCLNLFGAEQKRGGLFRAVFFSTKIMMASTIAIALIIAAVNLHSRNTCLCVGLSNQDYFAHMLLCYVIFSILNACKFSF